MTLTLLCSFQDGQGPDAIDTKSNGSNQVAAVDPDEISIYDKSPFCIHKLPHSVEMAYNIDRACRILFPLLYALFNLIYWVVYLYVI